MEPRQIADRILKLLPLIRQQSSSLISKTISSHTLERFEQYRRKKKKQTIEERVGGNVFEKIGAWMNAENLYILVFFNDQMIGFVLCHTESFNPNDDNRGLQHTLSKIF